MLNRRAAADLPGLAVIASVCGVHSEADAHFVLDTPAAMTEQGPTGDPQKAPPCGDPGDATPTGIVTTYQAGETIMITIDERITHPGHYRVALALNDPSELPEPPPVMPGATPCGSTIIDPAPVFPVLADGMLVHTEAFDAPQTFQVTLPDDVTCTNCTLQVIQFMSSHPGNVPGGCYYHHCAEIAIVDGPVEGTTTAGDTTSGGEVGTAGPPPGTTDPTDATATADSATTGSSGGASNTNATASAGSSGSSGPVVTTTVGLETDAGQGDDDDSGCGCTASTTPGEKLGGSMLLLLGLLGLRSRRPRARAR